MRLDELSPYWIRYETRAATWDVIDGDADTWRARGCPTRPFTGTKEYIVRVESLAEAQGIMFQCPKCLATNGHLCSVTFSDRGALDSEGSQNSEGKPSRWHVTGTEFGNLTTTPSIFLQGGCGWHGYITNGAAL